MYPATMQDPQLIAESAQLHDETQRRRFLAKHPEIADRGFVIALCDRAVELLWVNLEQATRLTEVAILLAEEIDDDFARGRCHRTAANLSMSQRDFRSAVREYEAALTMFSRLDELSEVAITQYSGLHSLCHLGRFDEAFEWAQEARSIFQKLGDRLRLARLEFNVGTILSRQDRFREALGHYRSAYADFLDVGSPGDIGVSLRNIAVSLQDSNRFTEALQAYREAEDFCSRHDLPLLGLEVEYNIAYLHYLRGEYARAIRLFELNRKHCERLDDPHHMALCDLDQSEIYLELNLVTEAAHLATRGRQGFEELGMRYEVAKCSTNLAIAKNRKGESDEAVKLLAEARAIFCEENNPVWSAMIDFYTSRILHAQNRSASASRLAEKARRIFKEAGLPSRVALCDIYLARLDLEASEPARAHQRCVSALERLESLGLPAIEHRAWMMLGRCEEDLANRKAALEAYRRAETTLERLRSHLQTDEFKITFLEDKNDVYQSLVALELASSGNLTTAFETIERAKSRSLTDLLAFRATEIPAKADADSDLVGRLRDVRQELNSLYRKIDLGLSETSQKARLRLDALRSRCRQREKELLRTLREIQLVDAEFSSLQQATTFDLDRVRSVLPDNAMLIEYYFARGTVYACLVGRHHLEVTALGPVGKVQELHRFLKYQLSKLLLGQKYVSRFGETLLRSTESYLRSLYNELLAPLSEHLDGAQHLVLVPHDVLHFVPFHALFDGQRHLIDRFSLSYAPSASVFYLCRSKSPSPHRQSLVMGVADESAPSIRREAEAVARILPRPKLLLGEQASEANLRRHGSRARIIHLATHGYFRQDSPMFSAIQLGTSRLSLFDLYDLDLGADLVVLSGCGTGLSAVTAAEELVGLARGLLYAGARTVLVTLWDVDDESTTALIRSFYRRLQQGGDSADALREAMKELRSSFPHPYYWAPCILIGDPGGVCVD